jgi:hypothetical protein
VDKLSIRAQRLSGLVWAPGANNLQVRVPRLPGLVWAPGANNLQVRVPRLPGLVRAPGANNLQARVPRLLDLVWAPGVLCRRAGLVLEQESSLRNSRRRSLCHLKVSHIYRKTLP